MTEDFDYIIVGAGSAGCVLANRLTEDLSSTVALVEAGGEDRNPFIHIPGAMFQARAQKSLTWRSSSEPDPHTNLRRIDYARGRVLGGTSSINGLIHIRGLSSDFDHWAQLGNRGWSADDVMPYYRKSEHWHGDASEGRGSDGAQHVSPLVERPALCDAFRRAGEELGLRHADDLNLLDGEGTGYYQQARDGRRRASTARTYLAPARKRSNLTVMTNAQAERIDFDGRRATGLTLRHDGRQRSLRARCEVIVSCGAIGSPQLLMLSGLGPQDHLRSMGIQVVIDIPGVGQNFQDHFVARIAYRIHDGWSINARSHGVQLFGEIAKYVLSGTGLLTFNAAQFAGFVRTRPELEAPDLQYVIVPGSFAHGLSRSLEKEPGMTCGCWQLRPESRGTVALRSSNPSDEPVLRPNSLSAAIDRETIVAGLRFARRWCEAKALEPYRRFETLPGSAVQTDDEWLDYARQTGNTVGHYAGTCSMGVGPVAVVDDRLRVRGVAALRVVDASVMPIVVSANTNATTIMIAEKAADMIIKHQ